MSTQGPENSDGCRTEAFSSTLQSRGGGDEKRHAVLHAGQAQGAAMGPPSRHTGNYNKLETGRPVDRP